MICHKCKRPQSSSSNFCNFCGAPLKSEHFPSQETSGNENNIGYYSNNNDCVNNRQKMSVYGTSAFNNNGLIVFKRKRKVSAAGVLSIIFGIFALICFIGLSIVSMSNETYKYVVVLFPSFTMMGFLFSIIAVYKDRNYDRVVISFYINFSMLALGIMYFGYIFLQNI